MHLMGFGMAKGLKHKQVGKVHSLEEKYIYLYEKCELCI